MRNILITSIGFLILIFAMLVFAPRKNKEPKNEYTAIDSMHLGQIATMRAEYQLKIDSLEKVKPQIEYRLKWLRGRDTVIYNGKDTICKSIINRKDSIICELGNSNAVLDAEAENYSRQLYLCDKQNAIEIKRFATHKNKMDSTVLAYQDSITKVRERLYSKFFKRNRLWNKNEFRKYVMK